MAIHFTYVGFILPYRLSFESNPPMIFVILDIYLDSIFLIDILITFLTPIAVGYAHDSKLIYDKGKIALFYLKGWFFLDLLACFPLTYLRYRSDFLPSQST